MMESAPAVIEDEEEFLDDVQDYMKQRGYVSQHLICDFAGHHSNIW